MNHGRIRRDRCVFPIAAALMLLVARAVPSHANTSVTLTEPANGSTVVGSIAVTAAIPSGVVPVDFYPNGFYPASSPTYTIDRNFSRVGNGNRTISAAASEADNSTTGSSPVTVNVNNGSEITITAPQSGTTVSGTIGVTISAASNVSWVNFYADGTYQASTPSSWSAGSPATWYWNTSEYSNGNHTISVTAYSASDTELGGAAVTLNVGFPAPVGRTTINASGTTTNPLIYDGHGAMSRGFDVTGSYVVIQGWNISTQANGNNGYGVFVHNGAHNVTIQNNTVHDLCRDGVFMDSSVSYINVNSNTIYRASMSGVHADGSHDNVSHNDISLTMQYPDRLGGIFAVCQEINGADADGMRFFGSGHVISYNKLHDVPYGGWGSIASPNPHTDCFQTWGAYGETTGDILIEHNDCRWNGATSVSDIEISSLQGLDGPVETITYKYNTFADMRQGINVADNVGSVIFDHNSAAHILQEVLIYNQPITSTSTITNNIFYDIGGGDDSYTTSLGPAIWNNDCIMANGSRCGTYPVTAPAVSLNPQFASFGSGSDPWLSLDFHLRSTSPIPTIGAFPLQ